MSGGYSVGGNDESGYKVFDPDGHVIDVGSRDVAESYAQRQNQLLRDGGTSRGYAPSESFAELFKSCAAMILGTIIVVVVIALIVNFIILHLVFH